jgi:hypothetical protein
MLYQNPKSLLQERLNQVLSEGEETIISDLMKLSLLKRGEKDSNELVFSELYNLLGLEGFSNLISLMDGRTVTFPSREEFKEALLVVLAYYYRTLEGKSWDDIKDILGLQDINSVKLGIQAGQYEKFLQRMIKKVGPIFAETADE